MEILLGVQDQTCPVMAVEKRIKISGAKTGCAFRRFEWHSKVRSGLDNDLIGRTVKRMVW